MNVNIEAIHFTAKAELDAFIKKGISKLDQYSDKITSADVQLTVVKPEVSNNKEVMLKINIPNNELVVTKIADTFEEAFDTAMDAMIKQIVKAKEKNRK